MKIAVWYHCKISGQGIPNGNMPVEILMEQIAALRVSGLADAARELHVGVSGGSLLEAASLFPASAKLYDHGERSDGERPTLVLLHEWTQTHPGWAVCYHHIKGVSHPGDPFRGWRRCMEGAVIWNWRRCVKDLMFGVDTVGAHWMTHEKYYMVGKGQRYWGGNFWWARSDFLRALPPLPPANNDSGKYYWGEAWIGTGDRTPRIVDYSPHWPMLSCAKQ